MSIQTNSDVIVKQSAVVANIFANIDIEAYEILGKYLDRYVGTRENGALNKELQIMEKKYQLKVMKQLNNITDNFYKYEKDIFKSISSVRKIDKKERDLKKDKEAIDRRIQSILSKTKEVLSIYNSSVLSLYSKRCNLIDENVAKVLNG